MARPVLSLVVPVRDEESGLSDVHARLLDLLAKIGQEAEVVFVNDGSSDLTHQVLRGFAATDPRYRVLSLSRPFGAAAAIAAGLAYARGQAVVALPRDLIDRADLVFEMAQKWREGYDIVHARARPRKGGLSGLVRRLAQSMLPPDVPLEQGAARLMSRRAVVAMRTLGESNRFVRGVVAWIGFKQTEVEYDAEGFPPKLGATWRMAWGALTAYSTVPLRLATYFGLILGAFAFFLGIASTIVALTGSTLPSWFASAIITGLFTSAQLVAIGILGDYVGKVYDEVKRRPLYVVSERVNLFAPDDDIVEESALPPPALEMPQPKAMPASPPVFDVAQPKAPATPPVVDMPSKALPTVVGVPAPNIPSTTAPMPIPKTAPMAQVPPPPGFPAPNAFPEAATIPAAPGSNPAQGVSRATAPLKTVVAGSATGKGGTLEIPIPILPEPPTTQERSGAQSYPPGTRSSGTPIPKKPPPPVPKRK